MRRAGAALLLAAAACAPVPPVPPAATPAASAAAAAAPVRFRVPVVLHLRGVPIGSWRCEVTHEAGATEIVEGDGGDVALQLPPGPASVCLRMGGIRYERPLLVGGGGPQEEAWVLVRPEDAQHGPGRDG